MPFQEKASSDVARQKPNYTYNVHMYVLYALDFWMATSADIAANDAFLYVEVLLWSQKIWHTLNKSNEKDT